MSWSGEDGLWPYLCRRRLDPSRLVSAPYAPVKYTCGFFAWKQPSGFKHEISPLTTRSGVPRWKSSVS